MLMKHPRKGRRFERGGSARERWRATCETRKKVIMAAAGAAGMGLTGMDGVTVNC
jgi:hypothetical protein